MKVVVSLLFSILLLAASAAAQNAADTAALTKLLNEFLDGASRNDAAMHDRFWAEDLIYTRSSGVRVGKAEIMSRARSGASPNSNEPSTVYTSEDLKIQQYGETAVVAFRLVGTTKTAVGTQVTNNLNTGTFAKRNGIWKAVAWQSTKMAVPEEQVKKGIASKIELIIKSLESANIAILDSLLDPTFVLNDSTGAVLDKKSLIEMLKERSLKFEKTESQNASIDVYGETAVYRGRLIIRNNTLSISTLAISTTFANFGGTWKAVAMSLNKVLKI